MSVKPIPDGYHTVTPYLIVDDIREQIEFLEQAFGAKRLEYIELPDGSIKHAEVRIGNSPIMMGQAQPGYPAMPAMCYLYVEDAVAAYERALAAGAESVQEPHDADYGDRNAGVKGPSGNMWWVATRIEDVPSDELKKRMAAAEQKKSGS